MAQLAVLARARARKHHTSPIVKRLQDAARTRRRLRESARQLTVDLLLAMLLPKGKNKKKATADDAPLKPDTSTHASAAVTIRTES